MHREKAWSCTSAPIRWLLEKFSASAYGCAFPQPSLSKFPGKQTGRSENSKSNTIIHHLRAVFHSKRLSHTHTAWPAIIFQRFFWDTKGLIDKAFWTCHSLPARTYPCIMIFLSEKISFPAWEMAHRLFLMIWCSEWHILQYHFCMHTVQWSTFYA